MRSDQHAQVLEGQTSEQKTKDYGVGTELWIDTRLGGKGMYKLRFPFDFT